MSFKIAQGLFKFDFTDHHAILGVPVDADFNDIRKRYMEIAKRLHPDSCKAASDADKKLANQLLAKLVSPAYGKFSNERDRAEYGIVIKKMGDRLVQEKNTIQLNTEAAKQLSQASDLEQAYKKALQDLAQKQYESFGKTLDIIGQISELNLVYLQRKASLGGKTQPPPRESPPPPQGDAAATPAAPPRKSKVDDYCRRAEELMGMKNWASAKNELQAAIKIEPNNSRCHGLLGLLYLKQEPPQTTMAKVHIKKALELNPEEKAGLEAKKLQDKAAAAQSKKTDKPGGLFGGLFGGGGKKK